jgi:hypothetical protein
VYGDYLATMFRENEESFFGKWFNAVYVHPARTIKDWYRCIGNVSWAVPGVVRL